MQTIRTQKLEQGVYSVEVTFQSYGRQTLTPQEEKEILQNYGVSISLSDIAFTGRYGIVSNDVVKVLAADPGDDISLTLNKLVYPLDETFKVSYSIKASTINSALLGTVLDTKDKYADALCTLFGDKIEEAIEKAIDDAVAKTNSFEKVENKTL